MADRPNPFVGPSSGNEQRGRNPFVGPPAGATRRRRNLNAGDTALDVGGSFAAGLAAPLGGLRDLSDMGSVAVRFGAEMGARLFGADEQRARQIATTVDRTFGATRDAAMVAVNPTVGAPLVAGMRGPSSAQISDAIHVPETVAGEYARTAGQFAGNAVMPGSAGMRVARVVVPAAATETAGQLARPYGPEAEMAARFIAAPLSSVGLEATVGGVSRANVARAQRAEQAWNDQAPARALESEVMPMTAGERAGDPRAMQREASLRRAGPATAQTQLRDFDAQRAQALENNTLNIATRGREATTQSAGDAGVVLADDLRSGYERMRTQQGERYAEARRLASTAPNEGAISATDELGARVGQTVDDWFLDQPRAVGILNRLSEQIRSGRATFETTERARQQLNVLLGDAMRSGTQADVVAIHRLIDDLDGFVEARLPGNARRAMAEARRYTNEMLNMYGEQARPDLSTGHVGRRDPGGRVIRNILETDMTGEQVIDSIFGAGNARPPRSVLAAVQRIHDRSTGSIATGGREATTAAEGQVTRAPGMQTMRGGRGNRGGRQFQEPSQRQQAYLERLGRLAPGEREAISDPSLQALREAFVYRLMRRLQARAEGDGLPFRQMATDLRQALDGTGAEITPLLFNEREIGELRRVQVALEQAAPRRGSYAPSAPEAAQTAIERSVMAGFGRLLGNLPWVGPSLQEGIEQGVVNARANRDARAALAPPVQPPRAPRAPVQTAPLRTAGAVAIVLGAGNAFYVQRRNGERMGPMSEGEARALAARINAAER